jgi:hypothetical protein
MLPEMIGLPANSMYDSTLAAQYVSFVVIYSITFKEEKNACSD